MEAFFSQFHFLRPLWLLAFLPCVWLLWYLLRQQVNANAWSQLIRPELLSHLLDKQHIQQKKWPLWGAMVLWAVTTLGLAGPAWKQLPQEVEQATEALVICWDLSPSMLAQDVKPSRLQRARLKIIDLLKARDEGLFALVAYSGEAYNVTPLTDDIQTLINLLPSLSPAHLPTVGSNPEMALENAQTLLKDAGATTGHIVFITDDIAADAMDTMSTVMDDSPYQLTLWPVGTPEGAPIPLPQGGFAKDGTGNMVIPKLPVQRLQQFANQQGAYYVPMVVTDNDVETLLQLLAPQNHQTQKTERQFDQWFEHGQYIPLLLLPFIALLFRRGWVFCAALCVPALVMQPQTAQALSWQDLWQTKDQQAQQRLDQGDETAAIAFASPERRANALYQQQQFTQAAEEYKALGRAQDAYNLGTALTQAGEYESAIEAFEKTLAMTPGNQAAEKNKAIAQKLLELQQQSEQNQQQGEGSDNPQDTQNGDSQEPQNSEGSESAQNNPQNSSGQQDSSDRSGDPSEMNNDESASESGANQQQSAEQSGNESDKAGNGQQQQEQEDEASENPYSQVADNEQQENTEQDQATAGVQDTQEPAQGDPSEDQQAMALTGAKEGEQSQEQQQLEMMLRKVPDDPGGLLREKFKYQYQQRQRDPTRTMTKNEAENRW